MQWGLLEGTAGFLPDDVAVLTDVGAAGVHEGTAPIDVALGEVSRRANITSDLRAAALRAWLAVMPGTLAGPRRFFRGHTLLYWNVRMGAPAYRDQDAPKS